jgi:hypothetical protein
MKNTRLEKHSELAMHKVPLSGNIQSTSVIQGIRIRVLNGLIFSLLIASVLWLASCGKDSGPSEADEFCRLAGEQQYDQTGPLIDAWLNRQAGGQPDQNLLRLCDWLAAMPCVDTARILCNTCIETLPPQSELKVCFRNGSSDTCLILDILMDEPLRFRTWHE